MKKLRRLDGLTLTVIAAGLILLFIGYARSEEPAQQRGWQLGLCKASSKGEQVVCTSFGKPLPETVCLAMKASLEAERVEGRVVCARVLIE